MSPGFDKTPNPNPKVAQLLSLSLCVSLAPLSYRPSSLVLVNQLQFPNPNPNRSNPNPKPNPDPNPTSATLHLWDSLGSQSCAKPLSLTLHFHTAIRCLLVLLFCLPRPTISAVNTSTLADASPSPTSTRLQARFSVPCSHTDYLIGPDSNLHCRCTNSFREPEPYHNRWEKDRP